MSASDTRKANVLTYLKAAQQQISQAMEILAGKSELRNQIKNELDSPLDDIVMAIEDQDFEDSFRLKL